VRFERTNERSVPKAFSVQALSVARRAKDGSYGKEKERGCFPYVLVRLQSSRTGCPLFKGSKWAEGQGKGRACWHWYLMSCGCASTWAAQMSRASELTDGTCAVVAWHAQHEDAELRLEAAKRLSGVATAIGPRKAREELVPFLAEVACASEDATGMAIAEELGRMASAVGGPAHAACLLAPLEALASVEETVIRGAAVHSINILASQLRQPDVVNALLPLLSVRSTTAFQLFSSTASTCIRSVTHQSFLTAEAFRRRVVHRPHERVRCAWHRAQSRPFRLA